MRDFTGDEQRANVRVWCDTARREAKRQTFGWLEKGDCRCILGIACRLYADSYPGELLVKLDDAATSFDYFDSSVPPQACQAFGLATSIGRYELPDGTATDLSQDNDRHRIPLPFLADFIESDPPGLFAFADGKPLNA